MQKQHKWWNACHWKRLPPRSFWYFQIYCYCEENILVQKMGETWYCCKMHHSHSKRIHRCHHQVNSTWKCPWKINIFRETVLISTFLTLQLWQLRSSWRERQREADAELRSNLPSCNLAYWGSQPSAGRIWIIMICDITGKNCSWTYCDIIRRMALENVFPEQEEGHWLRGRTAWRHIL